MLSFIKSTRELADFLGVKYSYFIYYLNVKTESSKYRQFTIRKKKGGQREIIAPDNQLLLWQRKLADFLLDKYNPRDCVHGFVRERSIRSNALIHATNRYILNIDIKDFFPSIHFGRVRGAFQKQPFNANPRVAIFLSKLCCFQGKLPQGAATSPIISNIICAKLDTRLSRLAKKYFLYYTRYADDITFSKRSTVFPPEVGSLDNQNKSIVGNELVLALQQNSFNINPNKVHLQVNTHRQIVTGLVVNKKVNVQRRYVRNIRAMLHDVQQRGVASATVTHARKRIDGKAPNILEVLRGKIEFIKAIKGENDKVYVNFAGRLAKMDNAYRNVLMKRNKEAAMRDFFISHASEDKPAIARPLAEELVRIGFKVWYDEYELKVGDSLRTKIEHGLANSTYGIVILSHNFFSKKWPQNELNGLWAKENVADRVILPIWFNLTQKDLVSYAPMLADKIAIPSDGTNISEVALKIKQSL